MATLVDCQAAILIPPADSIGLFLDGGLQCLIQVGDQVIDRFDAHSVVNEGRAFRQFVIATCRFAARLNSDLYQITLKVLF